MCETAEGQMMRREADPARIVPGWHGEYPTIEILTEIKCNRSVTVTSQLLVYCVILYKDMQGLTQELTMHLPASLVKLKRFEMFFENKIWLGETQGSTTGAALKCGKISFVQHTEANYTKTQLKMPVV